MFTVTRSGLFPLPARGGFAVRLCLRARPIDIPLRRLPLSCSGCLSESTPLFPVKVGDNWNRRGLGMTWLEEVNP